MDQRKLGQTSNIVRFILTDSSNQPVLGLVASSPNLVITVVTDNLATAASYSQTAGTIAAIVTPGTYVAPAAGTCGFAPFNATIAPAVYEFQFADALFATVGSQRLIVVVSGPGVGYYEIQLTGYDPYAPPVDIPQNFDILNINSAGQVASQGSGGGGGGGPIVIYTGAVYQATASSVRLTGDGSLVDNFYKGCWLFIAAGTGAGQVAWIESYYATNQVLNIAPNWRVIPDTTSTVQILPAVSSWDELPVATQSAGQTLANINNMANAMMIHRGNIVSAGAGGAFLDAGASAFNNIYKHCILVITNGTGAGQARQIQQYDGPTKLATIEQSWTVTPDATSVYVILPWVSSWSESIPWNEAVTITQSAAWLLSAAGNSSGGGSGGGSDPWQVLLPGPYGVGTAGNILGNMLANITSAIQAAINNALNAFAAAPAVEGYAAPAVVPTRDQLLFMIFSLLNTFAFTGTTQTVKKIDNVTTAMTYAIDDANNPTSHTRTG